MVAAAMVTWARAAPDIQTPWRKSRANRDEGRKQLKNHG